MGNEIIDIGSRLELFVDDYLIERLSGAELRLHRPEPQNVALRYDASWEGNTCGYVTVFQDGDIYRMYYRGSGYRYGEVETHYHTQFYCYAESSDGVEWHKPSMGLIEFEGSKDNNIILDEEPATHNFNPFKDANADCRPDEAYKGVGGNKNQGLLAYKSPDGIRWTKMADEGIITDGYFDSQNLIFWDEVRSEYRAYHRDFVDGRDIKTAVSGDFMSWPEPEWVTYSPGRVSELYTNGVIPYYRAPHIFLGFPTRYVDRGWTESTDHLPQLEYRRIRGNRSPREGTAVTDGMFMSSRDGQHFNVWPESFLRPGLRLKENWFYGDNYQNWGLVETPSTIEAAGNEISVYASEASHLAQDTERLRRYTIRIDGFVSVNAPLSGGELLTKPLVFDGNALVLNFSSSAAGDVRVEVQDARGHVIEGYALDDCHEVWGDDLARTVKWGDTTDLSRLSGQPVRLRFVIRDADLYSIQFRKE